MEEPIKWYQSQHVPTGTVAMHSGDSFRPVSGAFQVSPTHFHESFSTLHSPTTQPPYNSLHYSTQAPTTVNGYSVINGHLIPHQFPIAFQAHHHHHYQPQYTTVAPPFITSACSIYSPYHTHAAFTFTTPPPSFAPFETHVTYLPSHSPSPPTNYPNPSTTTHSISLSQPPIAHHPIYHHNTQQFSSHPPVNCATLHSSTTPIYQKTPLPQHNSYKPQMQPVKLDESSRPQTHSLATLSRNHCVIATESGRTSPKMKLTSIRGKKNVGVGLHVMMKRKSRFGLLRRKGPQVSPNLYPSSRLIKKRVQVASPGRLGKGGKPTSLTHHLTHTGSTIQSPFITVVPPSIPLSTSPNVVACFQLADPNTDDIAVNYEFEGLGVEFEKKLDDGNMKWNAHKVFDTMLNSKWLFTEGKVIDDILLGNNWGIHDKGCTLQIDGIDNVDISWQLIRELVNYNFTCINIWKIMPQELLDSSSSKDWRDVHAALFNMIFRATKVAKASQILNMLTHVCLSFENKFANMIMYAVKLFDDLWERWKSPIHAGTLWDEICVKELNMDFFRKCLKLNCLKAAKIYDIPLMGGSRPRSSEVQQVLQGDRGNLLIFLNDNQGQIGVAFRIDNNGLNINEGVINILIVEKEELTPKGVPQVNECFNINANGISNVLANALFAKALSAGVWRAKLNDICLIVDFKFGKMLSPTIVVDWIENVVKLWHLHGSYQLPQCGNCEIVNEIALFCQDANENGNCECFGFVKFSATDIDIPYEGLYVATLLRVPSSHLSLWARKLGKCVNNFIHKSGFKFIVSVGVPLIDLYFVHLSALCVRIEYYTNMKYILLVLGVVSSAPANSSNLLVQLLWTVCNNLAAATFHLKMAPLAKSFEDNINNIGEEVGAQNAYAGIAANKMLSRVGEHMQYGGVKLLEQKVTECEDLTHAWKNMDYGCFRRLQFGFSWILKTVLLEVPTATNYLGGKLHAMGITLSSKFPPLEFFGQEILFNPGDLFHYFIRWAIMFLSLYSGCVSILSKYAWHWYNKKTTIGSVVTKAESELGVNATGTYMIESKVTTWLYSTMCLINGLHIQEEWQYLFQALELEWTFTVGFISSFMYGSPKANGTQLHVGSVSLVGAAEFTTKPLYQPATWSFIQWVNFACAENEDVWTSIYSTILRPEDRPPFRGGGIDEIPTTWAVVNTVMGYRNWAELVHCYIS